MPLNTDTILKLQPLSPIKLDLGGGQGMSMERERMKLMREQFENAKKQQEEQLALAKLEESGRMAREQMQTQRIQDQAAAQAAAAKKEAQDKTLAKFSELNGSGDIEGARAMIPLMDSMGMDISLEGEENGLPRYRIGPDPEAEARAAGAMGYPTDDSGVLAETPGVTSTEDAFKRAQEASATAESTGAPARGPDQPDYTGAVPKNVLDMGAINAQTQARLNPALSGLVNAYPEAYRGSAESTAGAIRGLGLPAVKSVEMFDKMRGGPDAMMRGEMAAEAQQGQFNQKRAEPTAVESQRLVDMGMKQAKSSATEVGVKTSLEARKAAKQIETALTNDDPNDDRMIGSLMSSMLAEKGAKTEGDIKRALGMDSQSTMDQVISYFNSRAFGGLSPVQKNAILGVVRGSMKIDDEKISGFLDSVDGEIDAEDTDQHVARGWRRYRDTVIPRELREAHDAKKGKRGKQSAASSQNTFSMGDDAEMGAPEIPKVSRIAYEHNNPGNLMFADQPGAEKGEPKDGGGNWAKFPTVEAGLQALRSQVELDAERGLSIRDFIMKYAPPGDGNDTEKYISEAVKELKAESGDDPLDATDPYDVVRFVARRESGTEMPYQYAKVDEKNRKLEAPAEAAPEPTAKDPAERVRQLLKKGGY